MVERGEWRIRSDREMRELYMSSVVTDIMEWNGHVARMDQGRTVKKIFESKPEGSRIRGRPRLRWLEVMEKDLE